MIKILIYFYMINQKITDILIYSTTWCKDCIRAKNFFSRNNIKFREIDIEKEPDATKIIKELNQGIKKIPTIVITFYDNSKKVTIEPTNMELEKIFLQNKETSFTDNSPEK